MENVEYVAMVIEQVHKKTFEGELEWRSRSNRLSAEPTTAITVIFNFYDEGPYSAIWDRVYVTHPVGNDMTILWNPDSTKARLMPLLASGKTLVQLNEIFRHVLLEPRKKTFEAAMKELQD